MATVIWNSDLSIANDNDKMFEHLHGIAKEVGGDFENNLSKLSSAIEALKSNKLEVGLCVKWDASIYESVNVSKNVTVRPADGN
jgi:hypothetical protein